MIRELGEERARHVVNHALKQAPQTGFQMKHFGAVLGYKQEALCELERREQREKEREAERRRQEEEQQRALAERQLQERAAQVLAALPNEQREAYRQKALGMLPTVMQGMEGLVELQMCRLVQEDGLDHLSQWLKPSDLTQPPRPMFTIIDDLGFNKEQEDVMGKLTPEGEAFFRAWQRSQGFDPDLIDIDYKITKGTPQTG